MKYVIDLHLFSRKLETYMLTHGMKDTKGKPDKIALYNRLNPNQAITDDDIKLDRQKVTDKTRYIDNWLKGTNFPRLDDVILLCNTLGCDFDYFFTDMKETTHDIEFISSETELSESAIINLENSTMYEKATLDFLLRKNYFRDICFSIYRYMQSYYKEFSIKDDSVDNEQITDTEKMEIAEYRATKHFSELLIRKIAPDDEAQAINQMEHDLETIGKSFRNGSFQKALERGIADWKASGLSFNEYIDMLENNQKGSD